MTNDELAGIYGLYKDYVKTVFRMELRRQWTHGAYISHEDEEELFSHILLKLVKYLPRHDPSRSSLKTYIYTIVKTQLKWALIHMKGMEGRMSSEAFNNAMPHYDDPLAEEWMTEPVQPRTMDDLLSELPSDLRIMSELLLEGKTRAEVAKTLGWSRALLKRKLEELKGILRPEA